MTGILWLASYPRSGNTWLRIFLAACRADAQVDINRADTGSMISDRVLIDAALGIESAALAPHELLALLPDAIRHIARHRPVETMKVHDSYDARFPADVSRGVIHIVRNPLDAVVSLASFASRPIDMVIARMANEAETQSASVGGYHRQLPQHLRSWSGHAASWMSQTDIPMLRVRYEDMVLRPMATFGAIAAFAGFPHDPPRIARAIAATGFSALQAQEREHGFVERPPRTSSFFRRGEVGAWRELLTSAQVQSIVSVHSGMMTQLGYLAAGGEITDTSQDQISCRGADA
jgi:hypothetical protein